MNRAEVEATLRREGCSLTPQRRAVLAFLDGNRDHPTAPEIFAAVTRDFPVTSRATVYNTLQLLARLGVVRTLRTADAEELRFDPNVEPHHHLHCDRCGRIEDVPAGRVRVALDGAECDADVHFRGVCADCRPAAGRA